MNTQTMGYTVKYVIGNHDYVKGKYGEELSVTHHIRMNILSISQ